MCHLAQHSSAMWRLPSTTASSQDTMMVRSDRATPLLAVRSARSSTRLLLARGRSNQTNKRTGCPDGQPVLLFVPEPTRNYSHVVGLSFNYFTAEARFTCV